MLALHIRFVAGRMSELFETRGQLNLRQLGTKAASCVGLPLLLNSPLVGTRAPLYLLPVSTRGAS
jgi:hypothetical protein